MNKIDKQVMVIWNDIEHIVALMQLSHNSDFGHFESSIQEDCTFDANFFW